LAKMEVGKTSDLTKSGDVPKLESGSS
jgi:hypothetical protein